MAMQEPLSDESSMVQSTMAASWNSSTFSMDSDPVTVNLMNVPSLLMPLSPVSAPLPLQKLKDGEVLALNEVCVPLGQNTE